MIRTILWYTTFVFSLFLTIPAMLKLKRLQGKIPDDEFAILAEKHSSRWAQHQVKMSGARVEVIGLSNIPEKGAVLFISNHQSNFDIALFLALIHKPKGYLSKVEILKLPIIRSWMKYIRCVFIDRNDMKKSMKAIIDGINILKDGHSMVVFPEGTRSKSDNIGEFKAGSFKLCTKAKVPVVPVTISGTYKIMEQNNNMIKPADVKMIIHPAIITEELDADGLTALPETVKNIIQSAL